MKYFIKGLGVLTFILIFSATLALPLIIITVIQYLGGCDEEETILNKAFDIFHNIFWK